MIKKLILFGLLICATTFAPEGPPLAPLRHTPANPPFNVDKAITIARNAVRDDGARLVSENARHRAEFTAAGLRYLPKDDGGVGAHHFAFRLTEIRAGAQSRDVALASPAIAAANRVEYARGNGVVEAYLALDEGVEQLFVLGEPLGDGDLTLVGRVATNLMPEADSGGWRFLSDGRAVLRYSQAIAFDALGRSRQVVARLLPTLEPGTFALMLVVPGDWLATATYPVVVDPLIGGNFAISTAAADQKGPDVAYNDDDDEWLVVWQDARNGANAGIYGQRVNRNGVLQSGVITIWDDADDLTNPAVAYDTTQHRYLVVWQDNTNPAIQGRVLNANGTFYTSKVSITSGTSARTFPDVAYNPITDEYLVVWQFAGTEGGDIYARKVGVDGVVDPGGVYHISDVTAYEQTPAVMADPSDGRYLVVWISNHSGTYNIVGHRLLSNGTPTGSTFAISSASGDEKYPALAFHSSNSQALVVWDDRRNPDTDVYGRLVYSDNSLGAEFLVSDIAGDHHEPAVTYNAANAQYLIVWGGIKGRWVSADTNTRGSIFTLSDSSAGIKAYPAVAFGANRFLAVWQDYRNGTADIYGQLGNYGSPVFLPLIRR